MTTSTAREVRIHDGASDSVRRVHEMFAETIGPDEVEDFDSFRLTVSYLTTPAVVPKLIEAYDGDQLVGAMLGVYLRRVNGGMVLYAGVRGPFRRRGLYTEMRKTLLSELATESPTGLQFVLSEVQDGHWLHRKYLDEWGAFVAPLDYVQPPVQGLSKRPLNLMVMPQTASRDEIIKALPAIIREVYASVYRVSEPTNHPDLRHVLTSLGTA